MSFVRSYIQTVQWFEPLHQTNDLRAESKLRYFTATIRFFEWLLHLFYIPISCKRQARGTENKNRDEMENKRIEEEFKIKSRC